MTRVRGRRPDGTGIEVTVRDGTVAGITGADVPDSAPYLLAGLVDLQVNGFAGYDVNAADPQALSGLVRALRTHGTTHLCPTVVTGSAADMIDRIRAVAVACEHDPQVAAAVLGIHVEGPSLAAADGPRGAHERAQLRPPDLQEYRRWQEAAAGLIRIVTLAPELPGSLAYIEALATDGVVVSIGHTDATPDRIREAVRAGAVMSTHLGNGARSLLPRHPNHLWAQLAAPGLTAAFIGDGQHLPADTLTAMVRAKGFERAILTSDSATLAGAAAGLHRTPVGGQVLVTENGRLELPGTGLLAGSGATLLDCLRWTVTNTPFSLAAVAEMATIRPAELIGASAGE